VSNIDGENADFDEFDLPAANTNPPDETLEFEAAGQLLEPVDDLLQPAEESPGSEMLQPEDVADLLRDIAARLRSPARRTEGANTVAAGTTEHHAAGSAGTGLRTSG